MRNLWISGCPSIAVLVLFAGGGVFASEEPEPSPDALMASATALEKSAVKLHQAYTSWLRTTGRFEKRGEDGLYADLCTFRNSCRAAAWKVRAKEVPHTYWTQIEDISSCLEILVRYRDCQSLDPALRDLMHHAWTAASSFRGDIDSLVSAGTAAPMESVVRPQKNPPRVGPLRLNPNRFDIMSYLENRWAGP